MKKLIAAIILVSALAVHAQSVKLTISWTPSAAEMGGLSQADYSTNFTFGIYSTPNITTPVANWTVVTNVPATTTQITIPAPSTTVFYMGRVDGARESSPFSSVAVWARVSQATGAIHASKP